MNRIACALLLVLALLAPGTARAVDRSEAAFAVLHQFYAQRDYKPVWTGGETFNGKGRRLPAIIQGATAHGIDPNAYGLDKMQAALGAEAPEGVNGWKQAELFWTYNLYMYACDLAGLTLDVETLQSVVDGDIADNLSQLAPDTPLYHALQERLSLLEAERATPAGNLASEKLDFGRKLFKPGMSAAMVPLLRARMVQFGGFDENEKAPGAAPTLYDKPLAAAVARFQKEYGLTDDGAIGPVTLGVLNRTAGDEREQIVANLQRLREPHRRLREDRRIEVSIARYWLTGYDRGKPAMSMPVVVGQPRRQTISFRSEITGVRLNPTWTVPATIKKEDFIPQLLADPVKLMKKHGVKVTQGGKPIDPTLVDWAQATPHELNQVGFWRPAGDGNPLGRYRVIMDNPYDIYLHDTNHPELFTESMRAQSSGCVRVARPDELTAFILNGKADWNAQKTADILKTNNTTNVIIENKIPIYLDYVTAWLNDAGQLILGVDVYGLDKPRYDVLVKSGLTTQRNAQQILSRVPDILEPELTEAHLSGATGQAINTPSAN